MVNGFLDVTRLDVLTSVVLVYAKK